MTCITYPRKGIQTLQFPDEFQTYTEDKQKDFKLLRQDVRSIATSV